MIQLPVITAVAAEKATVSDALPHVMGFVIVVVTLAILWALCASTGVILQKLLPPTPVAQPAAAKTRAADDALPPETLVVIAAAVAAVTGKPRRIVSVQPHNPAWSQAGRQQIQSSHNIR